MRKRVLAIVAIVVAGFGAAGLRVVLEGRSALADGDAAMEAKRPAEAIAAWESAARWYLPLAPHVDEAYDRLRSFATARNSIGAWRAIRRAALATRNLWQPHDGDLAAANAAIAQLAAADPERPPAGARYGDYADYQAIVLARDPRPSWLAALGAIAGIACWLAGMALVIRRSAPREGGPPLLQRIRSPAVIAAIGAVAWVLGLYTA
jgi:hypothetical protein